MFLFIRATWLQPAILTGRGFSDNLTDSTYALPLTDEK